MLNPFQEYAKARSLPIPALVEVLQGKSDVVSLGVAHAALKEKTEAEVARKGAQAAANAQAPKVVSRDIAMAQGLAAMPADVDVPMGGIVGNEGQMTDTAAGGGLVAFQRGGQSSLFPDDERLRAERVRNARPGPGVTFSQAFPNAAAPRGFMDYLKGASRAIGRFLPGASLATATDDLNAGEAAQLEMYRTLLGLGYTEEDVRKMPPEIRNQIITGVKQGQAQQAQEAQQAPQVPPESQGQRQQTPGGIAALPTRGAPDTSNLMERAGTLLGQPRQIEGGIPSIQEAIQQEREGLTAAGFDFNLMKNQIRDIRAEKEELKGSRKEAANLRLIEAGLGILGGESPYAFVNIGKGATPALKGLAEDLKDIRKEQRAYDKAIRDVQLAENQIAAGVGSGAMRRRDSAMERADRSAERLETNKVSMAQSLLSADTQRYVAGMQAGALKTERELARQDKRAADILDAAEQAARDIIDPTEKTAAIKRYFREFYGAAYGGGATATDPADAARAELARRGLK